MSMSVSVIVPVRNREEIVERCLESIINQTRKPEELIVVDNDSSDNTFQKVDALMKRHSDSGISFKLLSQKTHGACPTRQTGLENAEGEFLIFFDSDDTMAPDLLERAVSELEADSSTDIVCWSARIHHLDGTMRVPHFMPEKPLEGHLIHTLLRPQGYMVRKDFLIDAGGWTKPVKVWNDLELGLRLLLKKPKLRAIPLVLAEIYSQKDSITGMDFTSKAGEWEKTIEEMKRVAFESNNEQSNRILRILRYRQAILAAHYSREGNPEQSKKLLSTALSESKFYEKPLHLFAFHYTRLGMRGAWRLLRFFY